MVPGYLGQRGHLREGDRRVRVPPAHREQRSLSIKIHYGGFEVKVRQSSSPKGTASSHPRSAFDPSLSPVSWSPLLWLSTWKWLTNEAVQMFINFCIMQHTAKNSQGCKSRPGSAGRDLQDRVKEQFVPWCHGNRSQNVSGRMVAAWRCSTGARDDLGEAGSGLSLPPAAYRSPSRNPLPQPAAISSRPAEKKKKKRLVKKGGLK